MEIGEQVKKRFSRSQRVGIIVHIFESDQYKILDDGRIHYFARKGDFKIRFGNDSGTNTHCAQELIQVEESGIGSDYKVAS